jgi:hypothetical protein
MNKRIMFLRDNQYRPVGCLAINVDRKNHRLNYQYSVLNPVDKFDRKEGRIRALGRLLDSPISIPFARGKAVTMHDVDLAVMSHLAKSNAPSRAIKAAKLWLEMSAVMTLTF